APPPHAPSTDASDARRDPRWDLNTGARNYAVVVTGYVTAAASGLLLAVLATRILGPAGYGLFMALVGVSQFANAAGAAWSAPALGALGGAEFVRTGRFANAFWARTALLGACITAVVATAPLWLPAMLGFLHLPESLGPWILTYFAALSIWAHLQQSLLAAKRVTLQSGLIVIERMVAIVVVLAAVLTSHVTVAVVVAAYTAGALGASAIALVRVWSLVMPLAARAEVMSVPLLRFSAPLLPSTIVSTFSSNHLDTFFIAHYLTAAAVGIYGVAFQILGVIAYFPMLTGTVIQQYLVSVDVGTDRFVGVSFDRFIQLFTFVCGLGAIAVAVAGALLIPLVFGVTFTGASAVLWPLMAVSALTVPLLAAWIPAALVRHRTGIVSANAVTAAIVNLVLDWLLVRRFGIIACAWGTFAACAAGMIVTVAMLRREMPIDGMGIAAVVMPPFVAAVANGAGLGLTGSVVAGLIAALAVILIRRRELAGGVAVGRDLLSRWRIQG
ncbi:MAG: hypothetical protein ABI837_10350, partial [Acidobacteriota bacterium]